MMNHLLLWMSARREGTMQALRTEIARAESEFAARADGSRPGWDLARLGHAELENPVAGRWRICPPVLAARSLVGGVSGVLCGARTPQLLQMLGDAAGSHGVQVLTVAQTAAPDLVELKAKSFAALAAAARAAGIWLQPRATRALISAAAPVRTLVFEPAAMPIGQGWEVSRFSLSGLRWMPWTVEAARSAKKGLFRFRSDYETRHVLRDAAGTWNAPPDAAKYRLLEPRHRPLAYSATTRTFHAALGARPPALIERALILASGMLPAKDGPFLAYREIELADAQAAAKSLGQKLH
jgi:hypothetical protein